MIKCMNCNLEFPADIMMIYLCPLCALVKIGVKEFHIWRTHRKWQLAVEFALLNGYDLKHNWNLPVRMKGQPHEEED